MALQKDYQNWQCLTRLSKGKKDIFKKAYERLLWTTIHQKIGQPTRNGKKSLEIYKPPKQSGWSRKSKESNYYLGD